MCHRGYIKQLRHPTAIGWRYDLDETCGRENPDRDGHIRTATTSVNPHSQPGPSADRARHRSPGTRQSSVDYGVLATGTVQKQTISGNAVPIATRASDIWATPRTVECTGTVGDRDRGGSRKNLTQASREVRANVPRVPSMRGHRPSLSPGAQTGRLDKPPGQSEGRKGGAMGGRTVVDLVGTCPKDFWEEWIAEGDSAGDPESGEEWGWFTKHSFKSLISQGDRFYVVAHGKLRGYALVTGIWGGAIVRKGNAVACTIPDTIPGFRGLRKRWWHRDTERPFPDWKTP